MVKIDSSGKSHLNLGRLSFAICGYRHSPYGCAILSKVLKHGLVPNFMLLIDSSKRNIARTREILNTSSPRQSATYLNSSWETAEDSCLIKMALANGIRFICIRDPQDPILSIALAGDQLDLIVNTDCPPIRGSLLYAPKFGILSVHAASLPAYRGNFTTRMMLYNNDPLLATAFIMTPWIDEGCIIQQAGITIPKGSSIDAIDDSALQTASNLYVIVLQQFAAGRVCFRRQGLWEGETYRYRNSYPPKERNLPEDLDAKIELMLLKGDKYAFYD